jgi:hypothetical protein
VNALSRIHECLRPDGVLLDVHPQPENSQIEIWQGDRIHRLGEVDQREDHVEIEASRLHLKSFQRRGLFAKKRRGFFDLLEHHPSVQSWQDRWAEEGYRLNPAPGMLDTAADLLRSEGELVIREPVRATSLRRLNADDAPAIRK